MLMTDILSPLQTIVFVYLNRCKTSVRRGIRVSEFTENQRGPLLTNPRFDVQTQNEVVCPRWLCVLCLVLCRAAGAKHERVQLVVKVRTVDLQAAAC